MYSSTAPLLLRSVCHAHTRMHARTYTRSQPSDTLTIGASGTKSSVLS